MQQKNLLLLIFISISSCFLLSAQEPAKGRFDIEAFKKRRADYIIENVKLTDSEAKKFIPLSNEFMDKRFELNRSMRRSTHELRKKNNKSESDYQELLDTEINLKMKEVQLEQEYIQKFKAVLSAEKVYRYKQADEQYMKNILDQRRNRNNQRK